LESDELARVAPVTVPTRKCFLQTKRVKAIVDIDRRGDELIEVGVGIGISNVEKVFPPYL
jgi:hypothetical protein